MKTNIKKLTLGLLMATITLGPVQTQAGQSINKKSYEPHELILEIANDPSLDLSSENMDKLINSLTTQHDEFEQRKSGEAFEELIHNFLEKNKELATLKNHDVAIDLDKKRSIQPQVLINILESAAKANNFALFKRLFHSYYKAFKSENFNPTPTQFKKFFEIANNKKAIQWIDCFKKYQNKETFDESEYASYCDLICFFNDVDACDQLQQNNFDLTYCIEPAIFYQNHEKYHLTKLQNKLLKQLYEKDYPEKRSLLDLLMPDSSNSEYEKQIIHKRNITTLLGEQFHYLPIDLLLRNYYKQLKNIGIFATMAKVDLPDEIKQQIAEY